MGFYQLKRGEGWKIPDRLMDGWSQLDGWMVPPAVWIDALFYKGPQLVLNPPAKYPSLGKPQKKNSSTNGRAIKRGGGGGKGRAIKEKITFLKLFFYNLLPFINKTYFTLDNISKYGHITLKFVGRYFIWVVTIFFKKCGCFSPKIGGRKKIVKIPFFCYFMTTG